MFSFCSSEKETVNHKDTIVRASKRLTEKAIYIEDSARFALDVASDLQKNEGRKLFLRGMDLLINNKNAKESIPVFKEAIMFFPDPSFYYYLSRAFIEENDVANATLSNAMCSNLNYSQYNQVLYNDALIAAIKMDTNTCINSMYGAIDEGFLNKDMILNEKKFDFIREHQKYISLMVNVFGNDEKLKARLFSNYMKLFPELKTPYNETIDSVANHSFDNYINYDYAVFIPGMEDGSFSRDVTNEYMYVGKIKLENNFQALIYKTYLAIADTLNPVKTFVITYDSLGNVVDNEMIGCFCSPTNSQAYTILPDYTIETTSYNYKWKYEPLEKGFAGNQIESFEIEKPKQIQVAKDGIIKREGIVKTPTGKEKSGG